MFALKIIHTVGFIAYFSAKTITINESWLVKQKKNESISMRIELASNGFTVWEVNKISCAIF